jgi:hypothetical protein
MFEKTKKLPNNDIILLDRNLCRAEWESGRKKFSYVRITSEPEALNVFRDHFNVRINND